MDILFRTDASVNIGTGHVMRCLTLADELRQKGTDISFICREDPGNLVSYIENREYKVDQLPGEIDIETDRRLTNKILSKYETKPDGLIIDHYDIDISYESSLRDRSKKDLWSLMTLLIESMIVICCLTRTIVKMRTVIMV